MTYGEHPVKIVDDRTDRIGIRTLVLARSWQASKANLSIDELDAESPETPPVPGGMEFVGRQCLPQPGGLRTFWTYMGVHGNGKDVTFKTRGNSPDYQFDPGFSQVSLALHPKIDTLLKQGGGYALDGEIIFPPEITGGGTNSNDFGPINTTNTGTGSLQIGFQSGSNATKKNPLFGHTDFFRHEGTYSYRYAIFAGTEDSIPEIEGRIFEAGAIPGRPRRIAGRNYLGAGAPYVRHGPVLAVTELYWMSGPGGWPKPIYGAGSQQ